MNRLVRLALTGIFIGAIVRQLLILRSIFRSCNFISAATRNGTEERLSSNAPAIYVVIPVLREAAVIRQTVEHFNALIEGHNARLIIVTTEREEVEHERHPDSGNTMQVVQALANERKCLHLHYPDPAGLKADQLNFAAKYIATSVESSGAERTFLLCYDADSRPPLDSLVYFQRAIAQYPDVSVFHQSSHFELRGNSVNADGGISGRVLRLVAEAGTLRANRFVLGFELPRLINRSVLVGAQKRQICSYVYTHVTGHGLCVRLSLLLRLQFPARSPLEDMHYSFILGSRNIDMYPVPSLDSAEVPVSLRMQVEQAARWFYGPGRFWHYLRDPQTKLGLRAALQATSAFGICMEWLSCAIVPLALIPLLWCSPRNLRVVIAAYIFVYTYELVVTEMLTNASDYPIQWFARVIAYPVNCMLFGMGGIAGATLLLRGVANTGKTERGNI